METKFSISKETNELLHILHDFAKIDERLFTWLQDYWGEDTPHFNSLYDEKYKLFKDYEKFILEQINTRISDNLQRVEPKEI